MPDNFYSRVMKIAEYFQALSADAKKGISPDVLRRVIASKESLLVTGILAFDEMRNALYEIRENLVDLPGLSGRAELAGKLNCCRTCESSLFCVGRQVQKILRCRICGTKRVFYKGVGEYKNWFEDAGDGLCPIIESTFVFLECEHCKKNGLVALMEPKEKPNKNGDVFVSVSYDGRHSMGTLVPPKPYHTEVENRVFQDIYQDIARQQQEEMVEWLKK